MPGIRTTRSGKYPSAPLRWYLIGTCRWARFCINPPLPSIRLLPCIVEGFWVCLLWLSWPVRSPTWLSRALRRWISGGRRRCWQRCQPHCVHRSTSAGGTQYPSRREWNGGVTARRCCLRSRSSQACSGNTTPSSGTMIVVSSRFRGPCPRIRLGDDVCRR